MHSNLYIFWNYTIYCLNSEKKQVFPKKNILKVHMFPKDTSIDLQSGITTNLDQLNLSVFLV